MLQSALAYLEETRKQDESEFLEVYDDLTGHYRHRLAAVSGIDDPDGANPDTGSAILACCWICFA